MQAYYMLGKYSPQALKNISAARTQECTRMVEQLGGEIVLMNALLGDYDVALIVRFPGNMEALKASLKLTEKTGISFTTYPAISVTDLDKIAADL